MDVYWSNAEKTAITLVFSNQSHKVLSQGDLEYDGILQSLEPFACGTLIDLDKTPEELAEHRLQATTAARTQRNGLLTASDWTQVADAPVDQVAWATYRQALRDITAQEGFPEAVVWPVAPN